MSGYDHQPTRDDTDVIGARIGATIIDSIIMGVLFYLSLLVFGGIGGAAGGDAGAGGGYFIGFFVGLIVVLFYGILLEGAWDGYTVGKKLFGIKVVKEDGSPCDFGAAFVRNLLEIIDGLFYYLVGFIVMAMSDKRQRIGDRLAGTVVVRDTPSATAAQEASAGTQA